VSDAEGLKVPVKFVRERALSPQVSLLELRAQAPALIEWLPGQYVELFVGAREQGVPYSIACAAGATGAIELAISREANAPLLAAARDGEPLWVSRPRGVFTWRPHAGGSLLVGIGTGLAPLRAMVQAALREPAQAPLTLLFGARREEDLLFKEEFEALARAHAAFRFEPSLSQPSATWTRRCGRVQRHLGPLLSRMSAPRAYVCGNPAMVAECVAALSSQLGLETAAIASEAH
jgi:NAD(P)H-flavin reductase